MQICETYAESDRWSHMGINTYSTGCSSMGTYVHHMFLYCSLHVLYGMRINFVSDDQSLLPVLDLAIKLIISKFILHAMGWSNNFLICATSKNAA